MSVCEALLFFNIQVSTLANIQCLFYISKLETIFFKNDRCCRDVARRVSM